MTDPLRRARAEMVFASAQGAGATAESATQRSIAYALIAIAEALQPSASGERERPRQADCWVCGHGETVISASSNPDVGRVWVHVTHLDRCDNPLAPVVR